MGLKKRLEIERSHRQRKVWLAGIYTFRKLLIWVFAYTKETNGRREKTSDIMPKWNDMRTKLGYERVRCNADESFNNHWRKNA